MKTALNQKRSAINFREKRKAIKPSAPKPDWIPGAAAQWLQSSRMPGITNPEYRKTFIKFVTEQRPNVWVTLRVSRSTRHVDFDAQATNWIAALLQETYARGWSDLPLKTRPTAIGFLEHASTNPHYNVLMRVNKPVLETLRKHGKRLWRKFMSFSNFHLEDDLRSVADVISYCTKEQVTLEHFSTAFIYKPRRKKWLADR